MRIIIDKLCLKLAVALMASLAFSCDKPLVPGTTAPTTDTSVGQPNKLVDIFVDQASTATKPDGSSWQQAFKSIEEGIQAIQDRDKTTIYVASGVYRKPKIDLSHKENIFLIGGYKPGDVNGKDLSNLENEWTILDGEAQTTPMVKIENGAKNINFEGFTFRNNSAPVMEIGEDRQPLIDGFNIKNSKFMNNKKGAAVKVSKAKIAMINVKFIENTSDGCGGGIIITSGSYAELEKLEFTKNQALSGGALCISESTANLKASIFTKNRAEKGGGAIDLGASQHYSGTKLTIKDQVAFLNNSSKQAGGAISAVFRAETAADFQVKLVFESEIEGMESNTTENPKGKFLAVSWFRYNRYDRDIQNSIKGTNFNKFISTHSSINLFDNSKNLFDIQGWDYHDESNDSDNSNDGWYP